MGKRIAIAIGALVMGLAGLFFFFGDEQARASDDRVRPESAGGVAERGEPADLSSPGSVPTEEPARAEVEVEDQPEATLPAPPFETLTVETARARIEERMREFLANPDSEVSGHLRSRKGTWDDLDRLIAGHVHIELIARDRAEPARTAQLTRVDDPSGEVRIAFRFQGVPEGTYDLTISTTDHFRWVPASLEVTPPIKDLEIWCFDDRETLSVGFRVIDAETLEEIQGYSVWSVRTEVSEEKGVLFHAGPLEADKVPLDAPIQWRLWTDGYAPAAGDERAFAEEVEGRWIAEVHLRRGWGRRIVVLGADPVMRPLRGARVVLDGVEVGTTNDEGALDVELDQAPQLVSASYGDLRLEEAPFATVDRRAHIAVLVVREPSE